MPRPNSRTERSVKPKIGRMEAHHTDNEWTYLEVKRWKVKVSSRINAHTVNAQHLPNGKAYELETWYTYRVPYHPYHRHAPWPPRSNVKVARSRDPSDSCWPTSRERNVLEILKLVERLPTPRAIMRTSFKVRRYQGQGHQADYCWDRKCIISTEREGVVYERQNWYADGACANNCLGQLSRPVKLGSCTWAGAYRVGRIWRPHKLHGIRV